MASTEQELMQLLAYTRIEYYCTVSVLAMLVYDCLTGTSREVELIWTRKIKATNCLFKLSLFANSFHDPQLATLEQRLCTSSLYAGILSILSMSHPEKACRVVSIFYVLSALQMAVIPTAFGVLRVYAVIDRDWRTTLFTLILGLFPTAIDILYFAKSTFAVLPLPDGHLSSNTITVKCAFVIITRSCTIAFDVFVISVLWSKCRQAWKTSLIARRQHSLTEHLLKDGTSLFLCLLVINVLHIILWLTIDFEWTTTLFLQPIACVLICRSCLLNLREVVEPPQSTTDLDGINLDLLFTPTSIQDQESAIAGEGSIRNMPTRSASSRGTGLPVNMVDLQDRKEPIL